MNSLPLLIVSLAVIPLRAQAVVTRASDFVPRYYAAVAYEPNSGHGCLFGGVDNPNTGPARNDSWRHDDGVWVPVATAHQPPPILRPVACTWNGHGMLLFGNAQTWLFDGLDWAPIATANAPAALSAMAYDPVRGLVVGFGGNQAGFGLTWEFDGIDWIQRFPPISQNSPQAVSGAMAWVPASQRIALVQGATSVHRLFEWDGANWSQGIAVDARPGFSLATAPGGSVLWCGGRLFPIWWGNNQLWNGSALVSPPTDNAPTEREWSHSWFDPVRNRTVVTSGAPGNQGTWYWDGVHWTRPVAGTFPPAPNTSCYDPWRGLLLQFGGVVQEGWEHDQLWARDHQRTWTVLGNGPAARYGQACAFDSWRGRMVVFGGGHYDSGGGNLYLVDPFTTHEWDGVAWHSIPGPQGLPWNLQQYPYGRFGAAMAFDRLRGRTVLFGGYIAPGYSTAPIGYRDDTWEWDGAVWTRKQPTLVPPAVDSPVLFFDAALGRCVLRAGGTWTWDGTDWTPLAIPPLPGGAGMLDFCQDEARQVYVATATSGTWELHNGAWQLATTAGWRRRSQCFDLGLGRLVGSDAQGWYEFGDPVAATLRPFGAACPGTAGTPVLHGEEPFRLGTTRTLHLANVPLTPLFFGVLGSDAPTFLGQPLPLDLTALGLPGCLLQTELAAYELRGGPDWPIAVPPATALLGSSFRLQAMVFDAAANPFGATTTNGLAARVGP